jgi:hypothetical protein
MDTVFNHMSGRPSPEEIARMKGDAKFIQFLTGLIAAMVGVMGTIVIKTVFG